MPTDKTIIHQTLAEQQRIFRIACDRNRYGLTLKAISMDSQIGYDSLRDYAAGETEMPLSALRRLVGVIPDELLSLLLPDGRLIVRGLEALDHDEVSKALCDYLRTKEQAHHPDSPDGREIAPCEDNVLRGKFAHVKAAGL